MSDHQIKMENKGESIRVFAVCMAIVTIIVSSMYFSKGCYTTKQESRIRKMEIELEKLQIK